jgi:hemolysin activation/secretion protein
MISLRKFTASFILSLCVASSIVRAQPVPDQILKDQENIIIREQEQRRLEQERILGNQLRGRRPKPQRLELLSGQESACFDIQEIVLLGELKEPVSELKSELISFEGRCLGSVGLQNVLRQITNYYIAKGFVTSRAYLKPQDISAGRLEVLVVEGNVDEVVILEGDIKRARPQQITGHRQGHILNIRDFEQGLDQINRLGSKDAKIRIEPGDAIGSSRVFIDVQDTYAANISTQLNNEGSKSTGRHQLSGSVTLEDTLGFYESLTVSAKTTLDYLDRNVYSRSINGYASIPWHYLTLSVSGSFQQYASEVTSAVQSFGYNGDSWEARLGADFVAYRDKTNQFLLSAGLTLKESRNFVTGRYIDTSSKRLSIVDVSGAWTGQVFQGAGNVKLSWRQGIDAFAAHSDTIFSKGTPRGQFSEVELSASWRKGWQTQNGPLGLSFKGFVSASPHTLVASERIGLGGPGSVRGFRDDSLSGDIGGYLQTEISWSPDVSSFPQVLQKVLGRPQLFAGLDGGRIAFDGHDPNEGGGMAGSVLGLRLSGGLLSGQLAYERPLYHPEFVSAPQRGFVRAQLRLSAQF